MGCTVSVTAEKIEQTLLSTPIEPPILTFEDGKTLHEYTILQQIGHTETSIVLKVKKAGCTYAMKALSLPEKTPRYIDPLSKDPQDEAAIIRRFDHPYIIKCSDMFQDFDKHYLFIIMEYCGGGTLMDVPQNEMKSKFAELVSAVEYMHSNRVAHCDIKPQNIMIHSDGHIRLTDFGNASRIDEEMIPSYLQGTAAYCSPELLSNFEYNPFAADIWSMGVTLFFVSFKFLPFTGSGLSDFTEHIKNDTPVYPSDADPLLINLISRMLEKNPKKRITIEDIWNHPWLEEVQYIRKIVKPLSLRHFKPVSPIERDSSIKRLSVILKCLDPAKSE